MNRNWFTRAILCSAVLFGSAGEVLADTFEIKLHDLRAFGALRDQVFVQAFEQTSFDTEGVPINSYASGDPLPLTNLSTTGRQQTPDTVTTSSGDFKFDVNAPQRKIALVFGRGSVATPNNRTAVVPFVFLDGSLHRLAVVAPLPQPPRAIQPQYVGPRNCWPAPVYYSAPHSCFGHRRW